MIRSQRDAPEYPLDSVKRAVLAGRYVVTRSAARGAARLSLSNRMRPRDWLEALMEICSICEERLEFISQEREIHLGTRSVRVLDEFLRCPQCNEEFYLPGQMDATLKRAVEVLRRKEGLMTPSGVRAIRLKLGLSQHAFEKLLGVGPKTVVRWEKGAVFQNRATDSLLRVVDRFPEVARFLADLHGVSLPDPSGTDHGRGNRVRGRGRGAAAR